MLKNILMILVGIFLLVILLAIFQPLSSEKPIEFGGNISINIINRIGNYAYILLTSEGQGNITLFAYSEKPSKEVFILNDKGIGMSRFEELVTNLRQLEENGFSIKLSGSTAKVNRGIYVVATGAMPFYVFDSLKETNATILYIGKKDLFLQAGNIKSREWYSELSEQEKKKILVYDKTLDEFLENKGDINSVILENSWILKNKKNFYVSGKNKTTLSLQLSNISDNAYLRVFYNFGKNATSIVDSSVLGGQQFPIQKEFNIFPDEKFEFEVNLNKTNGTVYLIIEKDGDEISRIKEARILDEGVLYERLSFKEAGDYVLKITDNSGIIGGTIVHVRQLSIALKERRAHSFTFSIILDGEPVDKTESAVSLNNGEPKNFTINKGQLLINARLNKGSNDFTFSVFGSKYKVQVENNYEDATEIYIKYGTPGAILVLAIYIFARLSRKPVYIIRIGNTAREVRKEIRCPSKRALELFKLTRKELGISGPITAQEFGFILKRHFTEGADVTEGNIEEVLKELEKEGIVQHKRGYYQLKGDGNLDTNVMQRIIREKLIERGINFSLKNDRFLTANYEIGFLGSGRLDKAIIVYDNEADFKKWFNSLTEKERATIRIKRFNGSLNFISIDKVEDVL